MTSVQIQKKFLVGLGSWLNEQPLGGAASRKRTRFVEAIEDAVRKCDKDRVDIIGKYVIKDENGEWKKKEAVDNQPEQYDIPEEKLPEVNAEYEAMMNEEWVYDITDSNRDVVASIKDILLNTDYKFGPREGEPQGQIIARIRQMNDYPRWCESFESLDL